ncbi:MAG: ImmA/IrrE family metallo-endopeptidase [Candidatus Solibacter sp.]
MGAELSWLARNDSIQALAMSDDSQLSMLEKFETDAARSLLGQLLQDSQLYTQSQDYKDLLDFVIRLRNFAPFNAMLLQVQKPGLRYAASAYDWQTRFGREPKEGARPLLILWPFGPVALVYDSMDTEGRPLPRDVASFFAHGHIDPGSMGSFIPLMNRKNIEWYLVDAGDQRAGSIRVLKYASNDQEATRYRISINRNHETAVQFTTLAHELGHLFLGHLGADKKLSVPVRSRGEHAQRELEAESVAYLVCERNGVVSASERYLASFVKENTTIEQIDIYHVLRAAGQVEALLGLTAHTKYEKRASRRS